MITTLVGKTFLQAYNQKYNQQYSAKDFFEKQYFELFFNHPKYLMTGGNSPFENPKISWEKMYKGIIPFESKERHAERLTKFIERVENTLSDDVDGSLAIGYPASEITATTSGLVSDLKFDTSQEDIYCSWIGAGLGLGVAGKILNISLSKSSLDLFW